MGKIIVSAPAKINLSLHITGKRADGYHLLESLVAFTEYGDVVEASAADELSLEIIGEFAGDLASFPQQENLVWKAAIALRGLIKKPMGAKITLSKNLPIASGIGGGSADAAATIKALAKLWGISHIPDETALALGSDVPVCLYAKPAIMRGVGEQITPAILPAQKYIVLVNPKIPMATAEVFSSLRGGVADAAIQFVDSFWIASASPRNDEIGEWRNDLQPAAIKLLPVIGEIIAAIATTTGCTAASMSGSGATCFGLYENKENADKAAQEIKTKYPHFWCVSTKFMEG